MWEKKLKYARNIQLHTTLIPIDIHWFSFKPHFILFLKDILLLFEIVQTTQK